MIFAVALGPLADVLIFIAATGAGMTVTAAHMVSFACATLLTYPVTVHPSVAKEDRKRDLRLYAHLLAVAGAALFLRGGVLALLMGWGLPAQWSILFAAAATVVVTRAGNSVCLSTRAWTLGSGIRWQALAIALISCAALLRLLYCARVELLPEEAYYWNYSRHLDIGYLDHPPMVAWLIGLGTAVFGDSEFGVRVGAICSGAVASFFIYRLTRNLFDQASALVALVLMQVLPYFFFSGIVMTPDAPLTAAWAALLFYLERALIAGRASAWWQAGLCLGLGLLSKYTIVMLVPAAFLFMLWDAKSRHWLRHWLPYVALALGLVIFSPVIFWNATHEWASFAFQTSRRLAEKPRFSLHRLIASALVLLTPPGALSLGATLWGRLIPADGDVSAAVRRRRFLQLAILVPLSVFCLFSLRHEVKLDWTGTLWLAAVPLLSYVLVCGGEAVTRGIQGWARAAWVPTLVVLLLIYGAAFHYFVLGLPGVGYAGHMEVIPIGWRAMGEQLTAIEGDVRHATGTEPLIVGLDRYEIASELAFYAPDRQRSVSQTSSDTLFGGVGLMYKRWFPTQAAQGRNILLVGWNAGDLTTKAIAARLQRLDPIQEGTLSRDGRIIRHYYYRLGYDYQSAATARQ